jgi:hypothetical protein
MARQDYEHRQDYETRPVDSGIATRRRPETKTFLATSEFWVMAIAVAALFVAGYILDDIADGNAWRWGTWVAIAYIVSRGIAKAGSQRGYDTVYDRDR